MVPILWIFTRLLITGYCQDVSIQYDKSCYSAGDSLRMTAVYSGVESVKEVELHYSGKIGPNLKVSALTCNVSGNVPAGYPDSSRMSYKCAATSSSKKKFTLTVQGIQFHELNNSWAASFHLDDGSQTRMIGTDITICDVCAKESYTGRCLAYIRSWYYDYSTGECKQFIYGGCGTNGNKFDTKEGCEERCIQRATTTPATTTPGSCQEYTSCFFLIMIPTFYITGIVIGIFRYRIKNGICDIAFQIPWILKLLFPFDLGIMTAYLICYYCGCCNEKQQSNETEGGKGRNKYRFKTENQTSTPQPTQSVIPSETREESGSDVSREDVDIQDHSNKLHRRPMQGNSRNQDKELDFSKCWDTSANVDVDIHPVTNAGIPEKNKGAHEPLDKGAAEEEPKKLKKKEEKEI